MKQKNKLRAITESYPDVHHVLQKTFRQDVGRPPVDDASPDLLATIEEIAAIGGAGDDRRKTESIRTCLTLDDLRETLKTKAYYIKRTTLYYRVYAACSINSAGDVGYSGPTYIAIRLAKHDKTISANHRNGFSHLVKLQEFKNPALDVSNKVKSIVG
ncbi:unnamed protein product [Rotaria sordida]|uniref:Uncharacterized protein n=1 Tax=Rotaria sordida TaxID=392033 RepID=A0A815STG6_9BILA|nr:unnamed protein product [Rotaria sordida]